MLFKDKQNKTISAIQNFKKSVELNPQNTNAKERLKNLKKKIDQLCIVLNLRMLCF